MEGNRRERKSVRETTQAPKSMRLLFGIFMILVYVGVGLLFILWPPFDIINYAVSCVVGGLLILYGIWRGYRLYVGMN
ncbi:MAG: hypothetical protein HDS82_00365 [Bacteroidales bacterium]|nr:hypothetical protein [Bacteroidales bacterium]